MVDPKHQELSISQRCKLLRIECSAFHLDRKGESPLELERTRRIDEPFLQTLYYGSHQVADSARCEDDSIGRKRARRPPEPSPIRGQPIRRSGDIFDRGSRDKMGRC